MVGATTAAATWAALKGLAPWLKVFLGLQVAGLGMDLVSQRSQIATQRKGLKLTGQQATLAAAMGRREEARADKMIERLLAEREKEYGRERGRESREALRASESEEAQLAMTLMMALSQMSQQASQASSRPPPSRMSMLSLMR